MTRLRGVELPPAHPVGGGGREGMVVVVPRLAEGQHRQPREVARLVVGVEAPAPEEVAQRVDREGHVVQDEQPHGAAPQQAGQRGGERPADQPAQAERGAEAADGPVEEGAIDEAHDRIGDQVRRVALAGAALGVQEEPAHVRVGQAAQRAAPAHAVIDVRAVRIAGLVGEGVVLAMVGHPGDDRPLDRRRAAHGEDAAQPALGGEGAVGEEAMEADRHAQSGEDVEDREDRDVAPVQQRGPHLPADHAREQGRERR